MHNVIYTHASALTHAHQINCVGGPWMGRSDCAIKSLACIQRFSVFQSSAVPLLHFLQRSRSLLGCCYKGPAWIFQQCFLLLDSTILKVVTVIYLMSARSTRFCVCKHTLQRLHGCYAFCSRLLLSSWSACNRITLPNLKACAWGPYKICSVLGPRWHAHAIPFCCRCVFAWHCLSYRGFHISNKSWLA